GAGEIYAAMDIDGNIEFKTLFIEWVQPPVIRVHQMLETLNVEATKTEFPDGMLQPLRCIFPVGVDTGKTDEAGTVCATELCDVLIGDRETESSAQVARLKYDLAGAELVIHCKIIRQGFAFASRCRELLAFLVDAPVIAK